MDDFIGLIVLLVVAFSIAAVLFLLMGLHNAAAEDRRREGDRGLLPQPKGK